MVFQDGKAFQGSILFCALQAGHHLDDRMAEEASSLQRLVTWPYVTDPGRVKSSSDLDWESIVKREHREQ
jgi:hypothetical protein